MKADKATEAAVRAALEDYLEAYAQRDERRLLAMFVPDPDLIMIGTGSDEKRVGIAQVREQVARDWSQSESATADLDWTSISAAGPVAWVAADLTIHVTGWPSFHGRLSAVLERRGDRWLFAQWHLSVPAGAQVEGTSWPTSIENLTASVQAEQPDLRAHRAPDGTVTILFSDIEGSTAMTERLGDLRWMEVLRAHNAIIRGQLEQHGGFEVKSEGDGFMLAFQSARRALQYAIATQRALAAHNASAEEPFQVRMGLHTGEVIKEADDFFGRHVILAARIANQAVGAEILVSALLRELTHSAGDLHFRDERELELKGLSGLQRVFRVDWDEPAEV